MQIIKMKYEEPCYDILYFETEDVIKTSTGLEDITNGEGSNNPEDVTSGMGEWGL